MERAALDQHGRDCAAALVQVRFDGDAARVGVRVGLEGQRRIGGQQDGLEQLADALTLLGGDVHEHDVAAVLFRDQAVLGELGADLLRVRRVLIDLVDRDDDRNAGGLRVVDGLNRLGHDAVIGCDHEDRDVGDLGTTGTHGCEGLVTGGVDEGDRAGGAVLSLDRDLVGTDVLGDAAVLGVDDVGVTDRVEQLGLTVVDVAHDGDDRRAGHHVLGVVKLFGLKVDVEGLEQLAVLVLRGDDLDVVAELRAQGLEGVLVEGLRGGRHLAQGEEDRHECCGIDVDLLGKVSKGCALADADLRAVTARDRHAADDGRVLLLVLLTLRALRLASALRAAASATECARRGAATAAATAAGTAEAAAVVLGTAGACTCATGTCAAATASTAAGALAAAVTGGSVSCEVRLAGHHARVRTVAAGARSAGTGTAVTGGTLTRGAGTRATVAGAARARGAGTRAAGAAGAGHALRGGVGVVARARATGARATGASRARGVSATRRGLGGAALRALAGGGLGGGVGLLRARLGGTRLGRSSLGRSGLGGSLGRGSLRLGGGGLLRGGLGRAGLGGLGGRLGVRLLGLGGRRELLAHLPHDGRFERGRRRLDEFTCFLQVTHQFFAGDSELFGELVDTQLCHISPFRKRLRSGDALLILLAAHRWVLIGCPSASNPLPFSRR